MSMRHDPPPGRVRVLVALGLLIWMVSVAIGWLSGRFAPGTSSQARPILEVLSLLAVAFGCYLPALREAVRLGEDRRVLPIVLLFAVCFRLVLLFSVPIQEVDIYRYVWDGRAVAAGVSPYRYSPAQVLSAYATEPLTDDLARLVSLRESSEPLRLILSRIHFAELTSVYPPVSQAVFGLAARTTPPHGSVATHLSITKSWIVIFDLAAAGALAVLLRLVRRPVGWTVAYAWCPLVLKEFANSGHLDAIAVCATMVSVLFLVRATAVELGGGPPQSQEPLGLPVARSQSAFGWVLLAGAALVLAIGAKLYAVVLVPLVLLVALRRLGWWRTAALALGMLLGAAAVCWPMLVPPAESVASSPAEPELRTAAAATHTSRGPAERTASAEPGLRAFLSRWEMNDFLFLVLLENLRPAADLRAERRPWFLVTSEGTRQSTARLASAALDRPPQQATFLLARLVTTVVFAVLALWFAWCGSRTGDPVEFLRAAFLTLAWLWLLSPTQNPWYWTWALPLVPFARSRIWLAVSGLALLYYVRFWLIYHWPAAPVPPSRYHGALFFDYMVTWLEFGPWLAWLAIEAIVRRRAART